MDGYRRHAECRCGGFEWTGGTGKYEGITGGNTFHYAGIGATLAYSVTWEGEWELP